ncbi:hypothetical protein M8J75_011873 [Diaphorina citri]|nr:hypothetical protein M8J75_011873 [Diaphorina citri]KAI5715076.1 hypothetical protein M8J77_010163 [Diaphorina citri]
MEKKLVTLLCLFSIIHFITSLQNQDDQLVETNMPYINKSGTGKEPLVKYVNIDYDKDWKTARPSEYVENLSEIQAKDKEGVKNVEIKERSMKGTDGFSNQIPKYSTKEDIEKEIVSPPKMVKTDFDSKDVKVNSDSFDKNDKETFDGIDPPYKLQDETLNQAFIPLSPNIKQEDLMRFLKTNEEYNVTPPSYQHFQLANPVKELNGDDGKMSEVTEASKDNGKNGSDEDRKLEKDTQPIEGTQTPTERESRKTNFIRRPYEPTWNKVGRNRPNGIYQPIDETNVRNVYRTNSVSPIIVRPETSRDKFQVIKVYAEKPKSVEANENQFGSIKPTESSEDFMNFYRQWNKTIEQTKMDQDVTSQEPTNGEVWNDIKNNKVENDFGSIEPGLNNEVTIRDMIRKQIEDKMRDAYTNQQEKFGNIKRSDEVDVDVKTVDTDSENEIDLEDKINQIETQMNKMKKNANFVRNSKIDRVFDNVFKLVKKCHNNSMNLNLFDCLKDHTLKSVEAVMFMNKTLPLVTDFLYLENDLKDKKELDAVVENRQLNYNQKIVHAINTFLNHVSLKVKLPNDLLLAETSDAGRGKKDKYGHMMLLTTLLLAGTMIPIKMGMIAMMAGKALMTAIVSLTLAIIMGLKKIGNGHASGHTTYEVINVPAASGGHGGSGGATYISRNLKHTSPTPLGSFHNPYSTYSSYASDNEHEGEIPADDTSATLASGDDRNYALPGGEEEKFYPLSRYSSRPPAWLSSSGRAKKP